MIIKVKQMIIGTKLTNNLTNCKPYTTLLYYNVKIFRKRNFCDPEPDHRNPNPRCAPNCWGACVCIFTPMRKRDKGDVTDGGCGGLRGVSRTVAACSRRPWCPPKLSAAVGRGASLRPFRCRRPWRLPSSLPLPSAVAPSFVPSAAVGRDYLRRFPLPSAVAPPFAPSAAVGRDSLRRFPLPSAVAPPLSLFRIGVNMP